MVWSLLYQGFADSGATLGASFAAFAFLGTRKPT
jgi:hypothetical protein